MLLFILFSSLLSTCGSSQRPKQGCKTFCLKPESVVLYGTLLLQEILAQHPPRCSQISGNACFRDLSLALCSHLPFLSLRTHTDMPKPLNPLPHSLPLISHVIGLLNVYTQYIA